MGSAVSIIGVDCATQPEQVGLAKGRISERGPVLEEVALGDQGLVATAASWIQQAERTLLALDAPLGWPATMGQVLASHRAGETIEEERATFFSRDTDRRIKERLGFSPLKVGPDRIAHTAHAALDLLGELRTVTGYPIPLAWTSSLDQKVAVIEVYPAATLCELGLQHRGYKKTGAVQKREQILSGLKRICDTGLDDARLGENADLLDACVCLLAGADFLAGRSVAPENPDLAEREGWIWVRDTGDE